VSGGSVELTKMKRTEKLEKLIPVALIAAVLLLLAVCLVPTLPAVKYSSAVKLEGKGRYLDAIIKFASVRGYKDSATRYEQDARLFYEQGEEQTAAQMEKNKKVEQRKMNPYGVWVKSRASGQFGYVDISGNYVISPTYKFAEDFNEFGLARVSETIQFGTYALWESAGYIDVKGDYVIFPDAYLSIGPFSSCGLAMFNSEGKVLGFVDSTGKVAIEAQYLQAYNFDDGGLTVVQDKNKKYGVINVKGEYVAKPIFENITPYKENGLAAARSIVEQEGYEEYDVALWGFINRKGEAVLQPQIGEFSNNYVYVVQQNEKHGIVNSDGSWLVKPTYATETEAKEQYKSLNSEYTHWGYSGENLAAWLELNYKPKSSSPTQPSSPAQRPTGSYCKECGKLLTTSNSTIDSSKKYCDSCLMKTYNDVINNLDGLR